MPTTEPSAIAATLRSWSQSGYSQIRRRQVSYVTPEKSDGPGSSTALALSASNTGDGSSANCATGTTARPAGGDGASPSVRGSTADLVSVDSSVKPRARTKATLSGSARL